MSERGFRTVLFWALLGIFIATAVITLLGITKTLPGVPNGFKNTMTPVLLTETVACMFAFWKQLTGKPFADPPDLNGRWEYVCTRLDGSYRHGGTCNIKVSRAAFGWEFSIQGKRKWTAVKNLANDWVQQDLAAPAPWNNTWGTFTGDNAIRYAYSVQVGDNTVEGYGYAVITCDNKQHPDLMEGGFYQLPPYNPFYGYQEYRRLTT